MTRIFVSYRREDTAGHAGRLQEKLRSEFGKNNVFMDVASIDPGVNFEDTLLQEIDKSQVMLVLIGTDWLGSSGEHRVDDADDYVRRELEYAFEKNTRVIPVVVRGADMPKAGDLPESLKRLSKIQALELRDTRWEDDLTYLLRQVGGPPILRKIRRNKWKSLYLLLFPVFFSIIFYLTKGPVDDTERFLMLLAQGNMQDAYRATAFTFQQRISEENFVEGVMQLGLQDNASAFWSSRNISNGTARLSGRITTKQRNVIPVEIVLIKEAGAWKVAAIETDNAGFAIGKKDKD